MLSEKVIRPHMRAARPVSVSSPPVSEGVEIRRGCQFIGSLIRALGKLPGGIVRVFGLVRLLSWSYFTSPGDLSQPMSQGSLWVAGVSGKTKRS